MRVVNLTDITKRLFPSLAQEISKQGPKEIPLVPLLAQSENVSALHTADANTEEIQVLRSKLLQDGFLITTWANFITKLKERVKQNSSLDSALKEQITKYEAAKSGRVLHQHGAKVIPLVAVLDYIAPTLMELSGEPQLSSAESKVLKFEINYDIDSQITPHNYRRPVANKIFLIYDPETREVVLDVYGNQEIVSHMLSRYAGKERLVFGQPSTANAQYTEDYPAHYLPATESKFLTQPGVIEKYFKVNRNEIVGSLRDFVSIDDPLFPPELKVFLERAAKAHANSNSLVDLYKPTPNVSNFEPRSWFQSLASFWSNQQAAS